MRLMPLGGITQSALPGNVPAPTLLFLHLLHKLQVFQVPLPKCQYGLAVSYRQAICIIKRLIFNTSFCPVSIKNSCECTIKTAVICLVCKCFSIRLNSRAIRVHGRPPMNSVSLNRRNIVSVPLAELLTFG